jgi:hypothetical protein
MKFKGTSRSDGFDVDIIAYKPGLYWDLSLNIVDFALGGLNRCPKTESTLVAKLDAEKN